MLGQAPLRTVHDPRAWKADTIDPPGSWYFRLSQDLLSLLDRTVRHLPADVPPTSLSLAVDQIAACGATLAPARAALETGRGFVILDCLPRERYAPHQAQALYSLIGQCLGRPFAQNVQGTLLYDVRDTGQDVRYGARFSVTNAESTFHTDNSFGQEVLDYVGLLCINAARSGGRSQIVSGYAAVNELRDSRPDVLDLLSQPFHFDRRGGLRPGDLPTSRLPILERGARGIVFRYLRYWIETGHEKASEPLSAAQVEAMDVLDQVLQRPEMRVEFDLAPGQMWFINNRWLLHNRTGFEDYDEPERRRHLVRLWLQSTY
jgi:hypothetical protein